jgi:hypothetical protein
MSAGMDEEIASVLRELVQWQVPPSNEERDLVQEVLRLPVVGVARAPEDLLLHVGMKRQQCHLNCYMMEKHDPRRRSKMVTGWWHMGDVLSLHSVIEYGDKLFCVTPWPEAQSNFIADAKIEWHWGADRTMAFSRNGASFPHKLRIDQAATIAKCHALRRRLRSGGDPVAAVLNSGLGFLGVAIGFE